MNLKTVSAKQKRAAKLPSYSQSLKLPNELHQRAIKYEKHTGLSVPAQLRSSLNDFLLKNNY